MDTALASNNWHQPDGTDKHCARSQHLGTDEHCARRQNLAPIRWDRWTLRSPATSSINMAHRGVVRKGVWCLAEHQPVSNRQGCL